MIPTAWKAYRRFSDGGVLTDFFVSEEAAKNWASMGTAPGEVKPLYEGTTAQPVAQERQIPTLAEVLTRTQAILAEVPPQVRAETIAQLASAPAHPATPAPVEAEGLRVALQDLLRRDEINTCQHNETYRGGAIWEICHSCGAKWADDQGGRPEWVDPPEWVAARAALRAQSSPVDETAKPICHHNHGISSNDRCLNCGQIMKVT